MKMQPFLIIAFCLTTSASAQQIDNYSLASGSWGGLSGSISGGRLWQVLEPVGTIAELSLPATETTPAMPLRVYHLLPATKETPRPTSQEVAQLVRDLYLAPDAPDGVYLQAIHHQLVLRHRSEVHREVVDLLEGLNVLPSGKFFGGGFGCGCVSSVIPIVGERQDGTQPR